MTQVHEVTPERQFAAFCDAQDALIGAMDAVARKHALSPLSAATICL